MVAPGTPRFNRRAVMAAGVTLAAGAASVKASEGEAKIVAEEHWAQQGSVKLYLYRKRVVGDGLDAKPVLFLVHGSSFSGRGGFDLQVPGHPNYSFMEEFARRGFDVWTMDFENYGRSTRNTGTNSDILSGVGNLEAAIPIVEQVTGQRSFRFKGQSSGAIRAGVFAMRHPERVERLVLDAFTWTGEGAPEIMRRRRDVAQYQASPTRPMTRKTLNGIFTRDDPSTFDAAVPEALADYELALGDSSPNGTYIDMAIHMPMVDPAKILCPVMIHRAETDGNATDQELLDFFAKLPNPDKFFIKLRGIAHVAVLGKNRHRVWHAMAAFLTLPDVAQS